MNIECKNLFLGCAVDFHGCCFGYSSHCLQQLRIFPPLFVASALEYVLFGGHVHYFWVAKTLSELILDFSDLMRIFDFKADRRRFLQS